MRFGGLDPGQTGALVIVAPHDGLTVLDVQRWRGAKLGPPRFTILEPGDVVAVERPYVGVNAASALTLSEWIGLALEQLRSLGLPDPLRPLASQWRAKVLRRSNMPRAVAKRVAIAAAKQFAIGMPADCADSPDVAEAWCMARFAWGHHRTHGGR